MAPHHGHPSLRLLVLLLALLAGGGRAVASDGPEPGHPPEPGAGADTGARLYLSGTGADGHPIEATVSGDVPLRGAAAACASCHLRSGIGAVEGGSVAARITGPALFAPRPSHPSARPAYDDASLARALRDGVDPAGRPLDPLMPRFRLAPAELAALTAYLRTLGAGEEPGVTAEVLRLATIVTPDASPAARAATLAVLQRAVESHNARTRLQGTRGWRDEERAWRRWELEIWEPRGPPGRWAEQLEASYRKATPFAVVSGAARDFEVVQRFCDQHRLPCLLPNVDAPPDVETGYAVHWGGGLQVEASVLAGASGDVGPRRLLQVTRPGPGMSAASRFAALRPAGEAPVLVVDGALDAGAVAARAAREEAGGLVLWLPAADVEAIAAALPRATPLYLSSGLLSAEPVALRGLDGHPLVLARPWLGMAEALPRLDRVRGWLGPAARTATRGLRTEDQTFFAAMLLGETLMHLEGRFQRDALLDLLDHTAGLEAWSAYWPTLGFGPGQRRLSRGCWLVTRAPDGRESARWLVP